MAKHSSSNGERSRVRLFYVEADLAPGEMENLTQALSNAIRPAPIVMRDASPKRLSAPPSDGNEGGLDESAVQPLGAAFLERADDDAPAAGTKNPTRPRKYRKPKPVNLDGEAGGKPFTEFANEKAPTSHRARYLVAAAWLHDYADIKTVTPDHIYTCYQLADWTFDVADPAIWLRQLKSDGRGDIKNSNFSINHIGLADVKKMNATSE